MKNQDLIDRYVYAVVKHLPRRQAEDIDRELHGLVEDMLVERCKDQPPEQKDVLIVLTELGTPMELAAKYCGDKESCLIGQPWYSQYRLVLKWVLAAIAFGLSVAFLVELVMAAQGSLTLPGVGIRALGFIGSLVTASFGVIGAMTVIYAWMQRTNVRLEGLSGNLLELPPVPERKEKVSKADAICEIIFSILIMSVFLFIPEIICGIFMTTDGREVVPYFNEEVFRSRWYLFIGIGLSGVACGAFQLMEGRYTIRLAVITGVCDLIGVILLFFAASTAHIVNPVFVSRANEVFSGEDAWLGRIFSTNLLNYIVLISMFATVVGFGVNLYRALKYRTKG